MTTSLGYACHSIVLELTLHSLDVTFECRDLRLRPPQQQAANQFHSTCRVSDATGTFVLLLFSQKKRATLSPSPVDRVVLEQVTRGLGAPDYLVYQHDLCKSGESNAITTEADTTYPVSTS